MIHRQTYRLTTRDRDTGLPITTEHTTETDVEAQRDYEVEFRGCRKHRHHSDAAEAKVFAEVCRVCGRSSIHGAASVSKDAGGRRPTAPYRHGLELYILNDTKIVTGYADLPSGVRHLHGTSAKAHRVSPSLCSHLSRLST